MATTNVYDRVKETSTTTGTGNFTLAGALTGFQTFNNAAGTSQAVPYVIEAADGSWECGVGSLSSSTVLVRTTVTASSNANAAVNFAAGSKVVFIDSTANFLRSLSSLDNLTAIGAAIEDADQMALYDSTATDNRKVSLSALGGYFDAGDFGMRLTLTSATPVTTTDVTGTTLYLTPYKGGRASYYTGGVWVQVQQAEASVTNSGLSANTNYDVFYTGSTIELLAWSTSGAGTSARATALVFQDGIYVKTGATDRRYVGTVRTNNSTQFADTKAARFVWNYYNQEIRQFYISSGSTHNYNSTTARPWNNDSTLRWEFVVGLPTVVNNMLTGSLRASASGNSCVMFNSLNSTTASTLSWSYFNGNYNAGYVYATSSGVGLAPVGYNYNQINQFSNAVANNAYSDVASWGWLMG